MKSEMENRKLLVPSLIPYEAVIDTQVSFHVQVPHYKADLQGSPRLRTLNRILLSREQGGWKDAPAMRPRRGGTEPPSEQGAD